MHDIDDDELQSIRCVSAAVRYDGAIDVELLISGIDDPVRQTFEGNQYTILLNWSQVPRPINLDGTSATERRCQEIVSRGVARLKVDLDRQQARDRRRWLKAREQYEAADW